MDFSHMDPSTFLDKLQTGNKVFHLDKLPQLSYAHNIYQESPESSDIEFSGGSPTDFTAAPPPFHNNNTYTIAPPHDIYEDPHTTKSPFFLQNNSSNFTSLSSMEAMREMIFRMAVMQPVHIEPDQVTPPKRKNVKISTDPQSVAARRRRERISHRMRILGRMIPGGTKLDTASMLDEAVHYLKFLKKQVETLELRGAHDQSNGPIMGHVVGPIHMLS